MAEPLSQQLSIIYNNIILKAFKEVLESNEFKERFYKHMTVVINDIVYSYPAKHPEFRRKENGGLTDREHLVIEFYSESGNSVTYSIRNITEDLEYPYYRPVADVVESGKGYTWNIGAFGNHSLYPREFMKTTAEQRLYVNDFIELVSAKLSIYGIIVT